VTPTAPGTTTTCALLVYDQKLGWRPLVMGLLACCGAGAGYAVAPAESPPPVTPSEISPLDARIWRSCNTPRAPTPARAARRVAIAEVGYPRSAAEANMLGGQALLLVSAMAEKIRRRRDRTGRGRTLRTVSNPISYA
jgi:hypothetical protein